jgi:two-component system sensor histidine kinase UhpB
VRDNGAGLDSSRLSGNGFGLPGLRERAALLGGQVTVGPASTGGAELILTLPLEASHE